MPMGLTCGHLSFGAPKIGHLAVERRGHLANPSRLVCHSMISTPGDFVPERRRLL
jgi:hypothetical protein